MGRTILSEVMTYLGGWSGGRGRTGRGKRQPVTVEEHWRDASCPLKMTTTEGSVLSNDDQE